MSPAACPRSSAPCPPRWCVSSYQAAVERFARWWRRTPRDRSGSHWKCSHARCAQDRSSHEHSDHVLLVVQHPRGLLQMSGRPAGERAVRSQLLRGVVLLRLQVEHELAAIPRSERPDRSWLHVVQVVGGQAVRHRSGRRMLEGGLAPHVHRVGDPAILGPSRPSTSRTAGPFRYPPTRCSAMCPTRTVHLQRHTHVVTMYRICSTNWPS